MSDCSFCKSKIAPGTGKMLVKNNGKVLWFCSRKCEKNMLILKRNPAKHKWSAKLKQVLKK
ncbi:50S ribosomal protein L24e [Candidatus Woesearchaeota archaeon]|nr:50S ribosomal protein L24e [Candidatus Woesearchaeota archaeon]MBT4114442.1 50S ribosomal protein L24e [Candidatus Woesearchaeota archaeon]MBT4248238.1 50S ribosomal protein L24e [Candidatus Woesearchaeota archaeon]